MEEIWKDIIEFENMYQISNYGRVKSLERKSKNNRLLKEKILKTSLDGSGYHLLGLNKNNKKYMRYIHRLVADHFLEIKREGIKLVVDHIDNDKNNNNVNNLQIITNRENCSKNSKENTSTSKFIGVHWNTRCKKWKAQIKINGKIKHLGNFSNEIDAANAYEEAKNNIV